MLLDIFHGFALNHDKSLQIYFFCIKRQAKNDFLKDVESTVGHKFDHTIKRSKAVLVPSSEQTW